MPQTTFLNNTERHKRLLRYS